MNSPDSSRDSTIVKAWAALCPQLFGDTTTMTIEHKNRDGRGNFFAVDKRTVERLARQGINTVVAYLTIAAGTGRDNITSSWSANAVHTYTSMSRKKAGTACEFLLKNGYLRDCAEKSRPRYKLVPYTRIGRSTDLNSQRQHDVFNAVQSGGQPATADLNVAKTLSDRGIIERFWCEESGRDLFRLPTDSIIDSEHTIWLPNELITGAAGEVPPIARLRQTFDPYAIILLLDLYGIADLSEDGGVPRFCICRKHEREEVLVEEGAYTVVAFSRFPEHSVMAYPSHPVVNRHLYENAETNEEKWRPFWSRWEAIIRCGLIKWVPHFVESDDSEAEVIHPVLLANGSGLAGQLGRAARDAAKEIAFRSHDASQETFDEWWDDVCDKRYLLPVYRNLIDAQMIGIAQLRYQPKTSLNNTRYGDYAGNGRAHLERYRDIAVNGSSREQIEAEQAEMAA